MNKALLIIKNILYCVLLFLSIKFCTSYYECILKNNDIIYIMLYSLPILLIIICFMLNIKDIIKPTILNNNKIYNLLSIVVLLFLIIVFFRMMYDSSFIINFIKQNDLVYYEFETQLIEIYYYENVFIIDLLIILLLSYRKINRI